MNIEAIYFLTWTVGPTDQCNQSMD